jgi:hypothetical protein
MSELKTTSDCETVSFIGQQDNENIYQKPRFNVHNIPPINSRNLAIFNIDYLRQKLEAIRHRFTFYFADQLPGTLIYLDF